LVGSNDQVKLMLSQELLDYVLAKRE